jgi:hypothetical protein
MSKLKDFVIEQQIKNNASYLSSIFIDQAFNGKYTFQEIEIAIILFIIRYGEVLGDNKILDKRVFFKHIGEYFNRIMEGENYE